MPTGICWGEGGGGLRPLETCFVVISNSCQGGRFTPTCSCICLNVDRLTRGGAVNGLRWS